MKQKLLMMMKIHSLSDVLTFAFLGENDTKKKTTFVSRMTWLLESNHGDNIYCRLRFDDSNEEKIWHHGCDSTL